MRNLVGLTLLLTACGTDPAGATLDTATATQTAVVATPKAETTASPEKVPEKSAKTQAILAETNTATTTSTIASVMTGGIPIIAPTERIPVTVNHKPVLTSDGDVTIDEGDFVTIHLTGFDEDGDALTYTCVQNCPEGGSTVLNNYDLNATTGVFTWQADYACDGVYQMVFAANDGHLDSDYLTVNLTVNNKNRTPWIHSMATQTIIQNQTLTLDVIGEDWDQDVLDISVVSAPVAHTGFSQTASDPFFGGAGGLVSPYHSGRHGTFTFTPDNTQSGQFTFTFRVTDNNGAYSDRSVLITVNNAVQAPAIAAIPDRSITATTNTNFNVVTSGGNGAAITTSISSTTIPSGYAFAANNFSWTPACSVPAGTYTVTFSATDGSLSSTQTAKILVAAKSCGVPVWTNDPSWVSTSAAGSTARTINIGQALNPNAGVSLTYTFVGEWDCNNRTWGRSLNVTNQILTVTNNVTLPRDEGPHFYLFYAQNQYGERVYRRIVLAGSSATAYYLSHEDNATSTANLCGAGNAVFQH